VFQRLVSLVVDPPQWYDTHLLNKVSILFYCILFYSILFYSILFYSIVFYQLRKLNKFHLDKIKELFQYACSLGHVIDR